MDNCLRIKWMVVILIVIILLLSSVPKRKFNKSYKKRGVTGGNTGGSNTIDPFNGYDPNLVNSIKNLITNYKYIVGQIKNVDEYTLYLLENYHDDLVNAINADTEYQKEMGDPNFDDHLSSLIGDLLESEIEKCIDVQNEHRIYNMNTPYPDYCKYYPGFN